MAMWMDSQKEWLQQRGWSLGWGSLVSVSTHRGHRGYATLSHTLPAADASAESSGGSSPQGDQLPLTAGGQRHRRGRGGPVCSPEQTGSRKRFAFSAHNAFAKIAIHRMMQYPFHQPIFLVTLLLARETHLVASQLLSVQVPAVSTSSFPCLAIGPGTQGAAQGWGSVLPAVLDALNP